MTAPRALVVEVDAAVTQLGLVGFLRARGYQCVAASSVKEMTEALAEGSFSFTLVDLNGHGTESAELIECLKLRGRRCGPIITVAGRPDDRLAAAAIEVDAMLQKPLSLDELQHAIDKLARPQAEALGPAPELPGARARRELELWCSPRMLDTRQIIHVAFDLDRGDVAIDRQVIDVHQHRAG